MHIDEIKQLISDGHYEIAIKALSRMVMQHPGSVEKKTVYANTLVQDLMPLSRYHLEKMAKVAYEKSVELSKLGESAHEQCTRNTQLWINFAHRGNISDKQALIEARLAWENPSPWVERDKIVDQLNGIARIRFALEECIKRIENITSYVDKQSTLRSPSHISDTLFHLPKDTEKKESGGSIPEPIKQQLR